MVLTVVIIAAAAVDRKVRVVGAECLFDARSPVVKVDASRETRSSYSATVNLNVDACHLYCFIAHFILTTACSKVKFGLD